MSPRGSIEIKALRQRCESQVRALRLPARFELSTLVTTLVARTGRPIVLWPVTNHAGLCGLWAAAPGRDYVFYESDTSPMHQAHIILHELAHLILGHRSAHVLDPDVMTSLLPDLDPAMLETVLQRARYDTNEEREAEVLASLLLRRLTPGEPVSTIVDTDERAVLSRLGQSLESDESLE